MSEDRNETEAERVERTQLEHDRQAAKEVADRRKLKAWAVYNRSTNFIESAGLPDKEAAEDHLQYLLERGGVADELSVVELPL